MISMELILQQLMENLKEILEESPNLLGKEGLSGFILQLNKLTNDAMSELVGEVLTQLDAELREDSERRKNYQVKGKYEKSIETTLGQITYERTYYKHKKTKENKYLLDELINVTPHMKKTKNIEARLMNEAADLSYFKSGKKVSEASDFSSTTVMNTIRSLEPIPNDAVKIKEKNKKVKTLYIEADEDHVAKQKGKQVEPKLVYVHEGYEENKGISDRKKLKNVRYFSGVYSNSDKLWEEVLDYLDAAYDLDAVNKIYLSGDAALWIRNGVNWIPDSKYVLDRYHLAKYVRKMTAHLHKSYEKYFWELLEDDKKEAIYLLLEKIKNETERETKLKTVNESIRYIKKHYEAIRRYYNDDYIGCSAEAHVSHLLSDRLSSRPLGWSRIGVDLMARLRVFIANGGNIYAYVMSQLKKTIKENKHVKMIKRMNKNVKSKMKKTIFNVEIPVISFGKTSGTYHAVNGLR